VALAVALFCLVLYALFFRSPRPPRLLEPPEDAETPPENETPWDGAYVIEPLAPNPWWTLGAIVFLAGALVCFLVDVDSSWLHSLWHILAAGFLACLTKAVTVPPTGPLTVLQFDMIILDTRP